ncbi:MAG: hypothetical protein J7577_07330 [Sphingobacteriaceae bacterium]|nr:hypothetical protein [Sphingobacteriaceae bacterium]
MLISILDVALLSRVAIDTPIHILNCSNHFRAKCLENQWLILFKSID